MRDYPTLQLDTNSSKGTACSTCLYMCIHFTCVVSLNIPMIIRSCKLKDRQYNGQNI